MKKGFHKADVLFLTLLVTGALVVRLINISSPLTDFHSWRQADTAAVSRNFVRNGFNLLKPTYDDLSSIQSGEENPEGLRFVEFPFYNAITAGVSLINRSVPVEVYGRLVSIFFALCSVCVIYYLLKTEEGTLPAVFGAFTYAFFPFIVFFTRVVLPESTAVGLSLLSIFFLALWSKRKSTASLVFYFLSCMFFALAVLVKPMALFFAFPLMYYFFRKYSWSLVKKPLVYVFFILSFIPIFLWRAYIGQFPQGVPASEWLITSVNTATGMQNIFFRPAFFRWIFYERISSLILGGFGVFLLLMGVVARKKTALSFFFLLQSLLFLFVFEGGNVQHEYYQAFIFPALAVFVGLGSASLLEKKTGTERIGSVIVLTITLIFSLVFSFYRVRDYYTVSTDLVKTASIIASLTPPQAKLITDTEGDTTLLYLSDRKGAPATYKDLPTLKNQGYEYFMTYNHELSTTLQQEKQFERVFENESFALFKL